MKFERSITGLSIRVSAALLIGAALGAAAGCGSGDKSSGLVAGRSLTGNWATQTGMPGNKSTLELTQCGASIAGPGTYAIEAGRHGSLSISGIVSGNSFSASITYDSGTTVTYTGNLPDSNNITGTVHDPVTGDYSLNFVRQ
jgi:hypothetical protein